MFYKLQDCSMENQVLKFTNIIFNMRASKSKNPHTLEAISGRCNRVISIRQLEARLRGIKIVKRQFWSWHDS